MDLSKIKVLWRQSDTMALYGIPYEMRSDVNQEPRHLVKSEWPGKLQPGQRSCDVIPRKRAGEVPSDWVWLGTPGWYGTYTTDEIAAIKAFLIGKDIPVNPGEWSKL